MGLMVRMLQMGMAQVVAEDLGAASKSKWSVSERVGQGQCLLGVVGEGM
jgi:hypothetical protein